MSALTKRQSNAQGDKFIVQYRMSEVRFVRWDGQQMGGMGSYLTLNSNKRLHGVGSDKEAVQCSGVGQIHCAIQNVVRYS